MQDRTHHAHAAQPAAVWGWVYLVKAMLTPEHNMAIAPAICRAGVESMRLQQYHGVQYNTRCQALAVSNNDNGPICMTSCASHAWQTANY